MLRSKQANFTILALTALLVSACGDDKTPDQYQREQANEQLAVQQAAAGSYRGTLTNQSGGAQLAGIEIDLTAVQTPVSDGTGVGSIGRASLEGSAKIVVGGQESTASLTQAGFTPADNTNQVGTVSATVSVNLGAGGASGSAVTFSLVATYNNGSLSGTITPTGGLTGITGAFNLTRNGSLPKIGQGSVLPTPDASKYYAGTYVNTTCQNPQFKNSIFCNNTNPNQSPVTMTVDLNPSSTGYAFVNLFADIKTYNVQLNFGQVVVSMPTAEYYASTGKLSFQGTATGDTANSTLVCQAQAAGYRCSYRNEAYGATYTFNLKQTSTPPNALAAK